MLPILIPFGDYFHIQQSELRLSWDFETFHFSCLTLYPFANFLPSDNGY